MVSLEAEVEEPKLVFSNTRRFQVYRENNWEDSNQKNLTGTPKIVDEDLSMNDLPDLKGTGVLLKLF